jgi:hypothetical protein
MHSKAFILPFKLPSADILMFSHSMLPLTLPFSTRLPEHLMLPLICISVPITLEELDDLVGLSESLENILKVLQ